MRRSLTAVSLSFVLFSALTYRRERSRVLLPKNAMEGTRSKHGENSKETPKKEINYGHCWLVKAVVAQTDDDAVCRSSHAISVFSMYILSILRMTTRTQSERSDEQLGKRQSKGTRKTGKKKERKNKVNKNKAAGQQCNLERLGWPLPFPPLFDFLLFFFLSFFLPFSLLPLVARNTGRLYASGKHSHRFGDFAKGKRARRISWINLDKKLTCESQFSTSFHHQFLPHHENPSNTSRPSMSI